MISYRQHQKHVLQAIWNYLDLHPHGIGKQILKKAEKFAGKKNERINNPSKTLDTYVKKNIKARAAWGKVYSFRYNAVYARVLPYYDRYPLVLVLSRNSRKRTFTGLNLHYIPPLYKKQLMHTIKHLYMEGSDRYYTKDYFEDIGQWATRLSRPCIHTYRLDKVLEMRYWNFPTLALWWAGGVADQTFIKAGVQRVWMDSRRKIFRDARWKYNQKQAAKAARKSAPKKPSSSKQNASGAGRRKSAPKIRKGQNSPRTKSKTSRQSRARTGKRYGK